MFTKSKLAKLSFSWIAILFILTFFCVSVAQAAEYPFTDGFETGSFTPNWVSQSSSSYSRSVTNTTSASGTYSLTQSGGFSSHYNGLAATFATGQRPDTISFAVRSATTSLAAAYFVLRSGSNNVLFFYMSESGYLYFNNSSYATRTYSANTWYRIKLVPNWTTYTASMYVNGTLAYSNVPFLSQNSITSVHLYNYHSGAQAWYDEIAIGTSFNDSLYRIDLNHVTSPTFDRRPMFSWFHHDSVTTYRIMADTGKSFLSPIFSLPVADTFFNTQFNLPFGKIFWKVQDDDDPAYKSGIDSFVVLDSMQPVITVSPVSLKQTTSDSASLSLGICNTTGKAPLAYAFRNIGRDSVRVLTWLIPTTSTSSYYSALRSAVLRYAPAVSFTNFNSTDSAALRAALTDIDVFLIPTADYTSPTSTHGLAFRNVLADFMAIGGTVISVYPGGATSMLSNANLASITYYSSTSSTYSMILKNPAHPLFSGISALTTISTTSYFTVASVETSFVLATYSSYAVVSERPVGAGRVILIGAASSSAYDSSWARVMANAFTGGTLVPPSWLSISTDSGTVASGTCADITVKFDATEMLPGLYTARLPVYHNAINEPSPVFVPCTLSVPPSTISYSPQSIRFALNSGDTALRAVSMENTGSSRFSCSGRVSGFAWMLLQNSADTIESGENGGLMLRFNTATLPYGGTYTDSLVVTHNASNLPSPFVVRCTIDVISKIPTLVSVNPDPTSLRRPILQWSAIDGASLYTIQMSTTPDFAVPYLVQPVSDTFCVPTFNLPIGFNYWRVKSDLNTLFSRPDTFRIQSDSIPMLVPMYPESTTVRRPLLRWNSATGASTYQVQVDTTGTFVNPWMSILVGDTFFVPTANLPYSRIFWRVSNSDYNVNSYSAVDTFWVVNTTLADRMSAEPDDFELRIAGSNPFNPTSLVRISVPKANVPVRLTVYDASGKKIKDLFSGKLDRGVHDIVFNGQTLAAGVYTCRMNAGRFVASARLVLTK